MVDIYYWVECGDSQSVLVLAVSVSQSLIMTEQEEPSEEQLPPAAASYSSPSSEGEEMAENYQREDLGSAGTIKVTNYESRL